MDPRAQAMLDALEALGGSAVASEVLAQMGAHARPKKACFEAMHRLKAQGELVFEVRGTAWTDFVLHRLVGLDGEDALLEALTKATGEPCRTTAEGLAVVRALASRLNQLERANTALAAQLMAVAGARKEA